MTDFRSLGRAEWESALPEHDDPQTGALGAILAGRVDEVDDRRRRDGLALETLSQGIRERTDDVDASISTLGTDIGALSDRIDALENALEVICVAYVQTDGAGGFAVNRAVGCTVSISGSSLQVTFAEARATTDYGVTATNANGATVANVVQNESATGFQVREFTTTTGTTRSYATTSIQTTLGVVGPRV
jgi:hypothetical protein